MRHCNTFVTVQHEDRNKDELANLKKNKKQMCDRKANLAVTEFRS